ncbi:hypothetical protein B0H15DRAFT_958552 [Mycena belliarum]|uniref:Uncharacterized protein n=1 Tax=Mycena belliarum TaxID=1033014 RepID=A0AAD6XDC5_9AGAR|nr:hypothetical protein B0H15DRAFT_958552 [Mycena belliae]
MQSLALDESDCPQRGRRLARLVSQRSDFRQRKQHIRRSASHPPQHGAHPNSAGGVRAPPPPDDPEARWRSGVNASLPARRFRESREGHEALKAAAPASRDVPGLGAGVRTKPATPIRPPRYPGAP